MQTIWPAVFSRRTHGPAPVFDVNADDADADFIDAGFLWRVAKIAHRLPTLPRFRCWWCFTAGGLSQPLLSGVAEVAQERVGRVLCPISRLQR